MKHLLTSAAALSVAATTVWAGQISIPLDQQINLGYIYNSQSPSGNAIYPAFNTDTQTFFAGSHVRHNMLTGGGAASWWYQYVDLNLAGITTPGSGLNLSVPGSMIEFDARFYQDNTNPYGDAPIFLRAYTYAADGNTYLGHRDYGIVYGPNSSSPPYGAWYPTWWHVSVDVNAATHTDGGVFDAANVSRIRFYGTDWAGTGADFVDFKNLTITLIPEPGLASLFLLGLGAAAFHSGRNRKQV